MKAFNTIAVLFLNIIFAIPCFGMISVGTISKDQAKEMGITMQYRKNGEAGIKVWLEFQNKEFLEEFRYCRLRMTDASGAHVLSAMLQPNPANHRRSEGALSVSFSAEPGQLKNCSFMIVSGTGLRGGVGHILHVKDFVDLEKLPSKEAKKRNSDQSTGARDAEDEK